ncbi:MAG: dTDP-glucose 4,6-dehydratase [Candidatus Yanofskybacteria bacterium]|nr:dTDP-glucose 4,6-dehydratase [Candidatus Yanofskybacteria bacterium]
MKTVLITGGCGFIGSHFVREFLKKHPDFKLVNLDKLTYAGNPDNLKDVSKNSKYKFVKGDIADKKMVETVFKKFKPDFVVDFAAESHVDRSIHGYAKDFVDTNVYGVFNLLEAAKKFGVKKFVQISTDEVYGSLPLKSRTKFTERTRYNPRSPYSASKAAGDLLCHSYFITYNLPVVVTHSSNNYGSYQYPEKLIPFFALRALKGGPLPLYGDGKNIRDWLHVLDNVEAIEKVLFKGRPGEVYNVGGDNEVANIDIAKRILQILRKPDSLIKYVTDRPGHDRRYALDSSKIKKELGWKPRYDFDKMLKETVKWYRDNPDWVAGAIKRLKRVNPHIKIETVDVLTTGLSS